MRHGLTDWNAELRFQGRQDIPLNATGLEQGARNGRALAQHLGKGEGHAFICSPMLRARQTMEIIREQMGLDPTDYRIDERLIESAYGDLEGMTIHELKANHRAIHLERKADRWRFCPPAGESLAMTLERVMPFLDELSEPAIVVAHGAVGRTVRKHFIGLANEEAAWFEFTQDRIFRFEAGQEELL